VLVFDDITPLIRAQKVAAWREVARRLAHEIKNPLNSLSFTVANIEQVINTSINIKEAKRASGEHLALVRSDLERIKLLVDRFMSFARPRQIQLVNKNYPVSCAR
jgi:two-component system nitrogen regulation sensor histidine kinase NtrY